MHRIGLREDTISICGATKTPQHALSCRMIGIGGDLKTADEDFCEL